MILTEPAMNSEEIKAEYTSSLTDLTFNSKPLINVLTMLAEENIAHAADIVAAIEEHLAKVQTDVKLPILYLVDCIAKNIGNTYTAIFSHNIVQTFCSVFKVVDEKTRAEMFKLRQTWNDIFPQKKLYAIDIQISMLDPAWPVTAQPPSNSIHFNPKFLKTKPEPQPTRPVAPEVIAPSVDTETISMQQKLIQKHKELIELQQKKLELELLQTQVKLQKQIKSNPKSGTSNLMLKPQNILLKPEVAKQLMPQAGRGKLKIPNMMARNNSGAPKIAPVNSALVAAASRPSRDPRLLRQQAEKSNNGTSSSSSNSLGSKTAILDSINKVVTNTKSVRDSRSEPRLANNKDNVLSSQNKTDRFKNFPKSRQSDQKPKPPPRSQKNTSDIEPKSPCKNFINLIDSPTKTKSDKSAVKSPSKSPAKHKKKDPVAERKIFVKRDNRDGKGHKGETSPSNSFKGVKGSAKGRNYIRRNRSPSFSPEPQDVDLRISGPPEKQLRLSGEPDDQSKSFIGPPNAPRSNNLRGPSSTIGKSGSDVDLRQLPAMVNKKRTSTDENDSNASKKTKTEMFDVLFGNEDTDLRKVMPVVHDRPPTPPPPIISHTEKEVIPKSTSNFEAIRAKLANATGRDKIMAKSFRKKRPQEDEDLRLPPASPRSLNDSMKKIIISSDDEQCIKAGTMTKEQEKQLMNKIIAQIEHQKLKEAQEKDKEESIENIQISDEEVASEDPEGRFGDKDDRMNAPRWEQPRDSRRGGAFWRGNNRRHWDPPQPRPQGIQPWVHQQQTPAMTPWRPIVPQFGRPFQEFPNPPEQDGKRSPDAPSDLVVDSVNQDDIKTINIDGIPRDIRYYDETAIIFMNWDEPKEISFQSGNRRVLFDDKDTYFLSFNEPYQEVSVNGAPHKVRLGAPSREIFIDSKPYECYFGGPPITIDLSGQMTVVKLDGPPPQVKIGTIKRTDLVAGKVNLIIDAKILVPVFLDAKVQKFVIDGETHTLKFVDALKTVLINDVPFKVEFGGLPKPITVHDKKHFIRFSVLPRGVKPGAIKIKDMEGGSSEGDDTQEEAAPLGDINEPALPVFDRRKIVDDEQDRNSSSPHLFQSFMQQNNLDMLSSVMASSLTPTPTSSGYQVENIGASSDLPLKSMDSLPFVNPMSLLPANVNINDLFQKLVATGIVATKEPIETPIPPPPAKPVKRNYMADLRRVTFSRPETLKMRQHHLYDILYIGRQCSSCGMRFPPEQSLQYSQHLDWHFRQNRKGKKNIRVAASRRWYYSLSDWKNYEELEDLEEREKNYFDQQQSQLEGAGDEADEDVEIPSVPADADVADAHCDVCQDKFDMFFNEEKEEWHLKNAIRVDGKIYHPVCYDDYQQSLLDQSKDDSRVEEKVEEEKHEDQNIPGLEIILDDDDEDEDMDKPEEVVIEESDESKQSVEEAPEEEPKREEDDDDVIINEVVLERIVVDDEKEYVDTVPTESMVKVEHIDDGFMDVEEGIIKIQNGGQIKIKSEPIDPDELSVEERPAQRAPAEPVQPVLISSMDGNTEPLLSVPTSTASIGGRIKINISKPIPVIAPKEPKDVYCDSVATLEPVIDPSQPLPPGEEPIQLNVKPALRGIELKKLPPVKKGSELTGMCSIM